MSRATVSAPAAITGVGLPWWQWSRARKRLDQWVRTLIAERPYAVRFALGQGSYVNFSTRDIVIEPNLPQSLAPEASAIPTTWGRSRVVRASTLEVLCARALAYHEAGHVLFTAVVPLQGSTHGWLVNALEDERQERLTAAYYPPASRDFAELGARMWRDGWKVVPDRTTTLLNACLFARWDHARPAGTPSRIVISGAEDTRLWETSIYPLVQQAWTAPNTATVAAIAWEILALIGLPADDATDNHGYDGGALLGGASGDTHGERHLDDPPLAGGSLLLLDGPPAEPDDDPDAEQMALDTHAADVDPSAGQLWMQPYTELQASVLGAVRRLANELRVATPDTEPVANNRRGRFDSRACVRSKGKTPVVRPGDDADDPHGLAIVLLIDGTSSMGGSPAGVAADGGPADPDGFQSGRMPHVRRAALLFERACAALDVPLAIGFARDGAYPVHTGTSGRRSLPNPVVWIKRWETPANAEGPRALLAGMYGDAIYEAVSRSLRVAQAELDGRPETVKLVIYLHDGHPEDETPEAVKATIDGLRRAKGTVILGLFLGNQGQLPRMQAIFGREHTIGVDQLDHVPARLGRVLARYRQAK
jgi:hypothetical protein